MKIVIGFSKPRKMNIISFLIMKICKTSYSHTYLMYREDITKDLMIIEASHGEVHEQMYLDWIQKNMIVREYERSIKKEDYSSFQHFINSALNKSYNKKLLIGIMIEKVFGIKNNIGIDNNKFICSEFVARAFNIPYKKWIEPKEVDLYLSKQ
jgi:hypothetical protein